MSGDGDRATGAEMNDGVSATFGFSVADSGFLCLAPDVPEELLSLGHDPSLSDIDCQSLSMVDN